MLNIAVIGTGVVGSALALLLSKKGHTITGVCSKTGISAGKLAAELKCGFSNTPADMLKEADIIFLSIPDREIAGMAKELASSKMVRDEHIFYHVSGALPAEVLNPLKACGASIGSLHPLQSFACIDKAIDNIPDSFFAIQGEPKANEIAFGIVGDLAGKPFILKSEDKVLYHLGAVVASNYLVSLVHYAVGIYKEIGMSCEQALSALMPLIKGTLANIEAIGPAKALTGPVARGDTGTIAGHLEALEDLDPRYSEIYDTLGRYAVRVALEKGSINLGDANGVLSTFRKEELEQWQTTK